MDSSISLVRFLFRNFFLFLINNLNKFEHKIEFFKLLVESILRNNDEDVHVLIELAENLFIDIFQKSKKAH